MFKHHLFLELDAFNLRWQSVYPTIFAAAKAAECLDLYSAWLYTADGMKYKATMLGVRDTLKIIRLDQEGMQRMTFRITSLRADASKH